MISATERRNKLYCSISCKNHVFYIHTKAAPPPKRSTCIVCMPPLATDEYNVMMMSKLEKCIQAHTVPVVFSNTDYRTASGDVVCWLYSNITCLDKLVVADRVKALMVAAYDTVVKTTKRDLNASFGLSVSVTASGVCKMQAYLKNTGQKRVKVSLGQMILKYRYGCTDTDKQYSHLCHNSWCMNPSHGIPESSQDNQGRKGCSNGSCTGCTHNPPCLIVGVNSK